MQSSSISFRLVIVLLASCVATVAQCAPEHLQAQQSHGRQAEQSGQLATPLGELAPYELPLDLNETARATSQSAAAFQLPQLAAAMRALVAGEAASADTAIDSTLRTTCATLLECSASFIELPPGARATIDGRILPNETPEQALATLQRLVADDQRMTLLSVAAPVQR